MAIVKNVEFQGSKVISTNNGDISINQGTGELLIRKKRRGTDAGKLARIHLQRT